MIYFCTLFDNRYLDRGLSLHASLLTQGQSFHLWILCMDPESYEALARHDLQNVSLVTIEDLANHDRDILEAKSNRSLIEFYFTSKSFLCLYILDTQHRVDLITYLDADLYFFGCPTAVAEEMKDYSIGITPHRFPPHLRINEQFGRFNAGFVSIRRDTTGLAGLRWWRNRCFEWCHDYVSDGRFADQRYLDAFPTSFQHVRIIDNKGINAAPWNISQYETIWNGKSVMINDDPLVLYHFHGIKHLCSSYYDTGLATYHNVLNDSVRRFIYRPYLEVLSRYEAHELHLISKDPIRTGAGSVDRIKRMFPSLRRSLYFIKDILMIAYYRSLIRFTERT